MNSEKFSCPRCGIKVPKIKSVYMTNFTKIGCEGCGAIIRPDRKSLSIIGGIGGGIGGGLGGVIASYGVTTGNWLLAGFAFVLLLSVLLFVCSYCTLKFTSFIEIRDNA